MGLRVGVKSKDKGLNKLLTAMQLFKRGDVQIGVFGETGGDVVLRASVHEFGAPSRNIPQRSYLRATLDEKRPEFIRHAARATGAVTRAKDPRKELAVQLARLGERAVSMIRKRIRSHIPPPLKPATIAAKGSSTPLIDTGRLIQAITYKVAIK